MGVFQNRIIKNGGIKLEIITVSPGDTVYSIAGRYGLSAEKIISDNGLNSSGNLVVGQSLILLFPQLVHLSESGETVQDVALQYGVSERDIFRNNYFLGGRRTLSAGELVVIEYESLPRSERIIGGYAYEFISDNLLRSVVSYMTYVMPFTYGFTEQGELIAPRDERIIQTALDYGASPLMHLSTLTKYGNFSNDLADAMLSNPAAVENLQQNILENIRLKGYLGLDVDFEYLFRRDRDLYSAFIASTTRLLNENGYICIVAVPPKVSDEQQGQLYEGIDYAALGEAANYVFVMTYEWGYRFGPPMAVSPINSVRRVMDYAVSVIPREKILLGISNYGYNWTLPFVRGESDAPSLSTVEAVNIALYYNATIEFDEAAQSPYFYYTDPSGREHVVWFEDARSYEAKVRLIEEYNLAGGFIWDLMRENPQGYVTLNAMIEAV